MSEIGLYGLAVMGQNLALNIAEKGFKISVCNRSYEKTVTTVERSKKEGKGKYQLVGFEKVEDFVNSLKKPRRIILLVQAGKPVDMTIETLGKYLEEGDAIIDGGNEWYENTERRQKSCLTKGILYLGMGVSGGEEGARNGPSLMPGGSKDVYDSISHILKKCAAQVSDSGPCVTYIGKGGSGNYVKMIHNGIEYGDMQLISEAYDLLKHVAGLNNEEISNVFSEWNKGKLSSYLIEITAQIFKKKDPLKKDGYLIDSILDSSGSKGTGKWTVQESAERGLASPTIAAALDSRYISSAKSDRVQASKFLDGPKPNVVKDKKEIKQLVDNIRDALYASKIMSYTQGMNLIKQASEEFKWGLNLGEISRIWKGGCIIRCVFLDRITDAYQKNGKLISLLMDKEFKEEVSLRQNAWRNVVCLAIMNGVPIPAFSASLAYYDACRREKLPANLVQAQRDFFGAHTFKRTDKSEKENFHEENWSSKL